MCLRLYSSKNRHQPKFGPSLSVSNSNSLSKIRLMIVKQNERNDDVGRFWMVSAE